LTRRDNQNFRLRAAIIITTRHQIFIQMSRSSHQNCRAAPMAKYVSGNVRRVVIWALQYFGDITIDRVTEAKLADYVDRRLSQPRQPAVVTLKNERNAIRQLPRFAKRKGYVSDVPAFSIKSGKTNACPNIPEVEWHTCR
jgi:hypothetical protein